METRPSLDSFILKRPPLSSFDSSQSALSHSQMTIDKMRSEAAQAKATADQMQSAGALAKEAAAGTANQLIGGPANLLRSMKNIPKDLFGLATGKGVDQSEMLGQKTVQAKLAGGESYPKVAGQAALDAASVLPVGKGVGLAKTGIAKLVQKTGISKFLADRVEKKATQAAISAVDPTLKSKKLELAYQKVGTGDRTVKPQSLFGEQALEPDEQTIRLGTRLKGTLRGRSGTENLENIATDMKRTEDEISTLLKGDPDVVYNADKPTLMKSLEGQRSGIPREFSAIKDSKNVYESVIQFAQKTVQQSDDSVEGIRNARVAFDAQAKREFPSAYKDGKIDIKTPAGRAIKGVRDELNEHLYKTAPEGSKIKDLILREADLFRAIERIAPDAAKKEGLSRVREIIKRHPYIAGTLTGVLGTGAIAEIKGGQ